MGFLAAMVVVVAAVTLTCAGADNLIKVGGNAGWTQNVNYTDWASHRQFYVGDWLYFVFDKRQYSVLEVNETNYEKCIDSDFIRNVTKGGRDVYRLTEPRDYYFLSGGGYCFQGMKVAINVHQLAPSPNSTNTPPPVTSAAASKKQIWAVDQIITILPLFMIINFVFIQIMY